jgi:alpha-ketoglutarate-dependent taurine dioxygenase
MTLPLAQLRLHDEPFNRAALSDAVATTGWATLGTACSSRRDALGVLEDLREIFGAIVPHSAASWSADVTTVDEYNDRSVRRPQSESGPQFPHTDGVLSPVLPGVLAMLCLERAEDGGASVLVDLRPFLDEHPGSGFLDPLSDPDAVHIERGEVQTNVSVLRRRGPFTDVALSAHEYNTAKPKASCQAPFAALVDFASGADVRRRVLLAPGELLLVANRFCLHGREAFIDQPSRRRHLVRAWYVGPPAGTCAAFDGHVVPDGD